MKAASPAPTRWFGSEPLRSSLCLFSRYSTFPSSLSLASLWEVVSLFRVCLKPWWRSLCSMLVNISTSEMCESAVRAGGRGGGRGGSYLNQKIFYTVPMTRLFWAVYLSRCDSLASDSSWMSFERNATNCCWGLSRTQNRYVLLLCVWKHSGGVFSSVTARVGICWDPSHLVRAVCDTKSWRSNDTCSMRRTRDVV